MPNHFSLGPGCSEGPIQPQLEQPAFIANRPRLNHPFAAVACLAFRPQESFPFLVAENSSDSIPDHHDTPQRHCAALRRLAFRVHWPSNSSGPR